MRKMRQLRPPLFNAQTMRIEQTVEFDILLA